MKIINIFFGALFFSIKVMQAAEIQESTFLLKKLPKTINALRVEDIKIRLYCERFPAFSWQHVGALYRSLPSASRKKIKKLSEQIRLLHDIIELPQETQDHIFLYMLDNDVGAREKFYEKAVADAFERYQYIEKAIGRSTYPMGLLYKLPNKDLVLKLQHINPWYYSTPIIKIADQTTVTQINKEDEETRQHFKGERVIVIPDGCNKECVCKISKKCCLCNSLLVAFLFGVGALIGSCSPAGVGCVCQPPCVGTVLITSGCSSTAILLPEICDGIGLCADCTKIDL